MQYSLKNKTTVHFRFHPWGENGESKWVEVNVRKG